MISDEVLTHYDVNLPVKLACGASQYGIGAVLSHTMRDGLERPIAYSSRSLTNAERHYAQIYKEAPALLWDVRSSIIICMGEDSPWLPIIHLLCQFSIQKSVCQPWRLPDYKDTLCSLQGVTTILNTRTLQNIQMQIHCLGYHRKTWKVWKIQWRYFTCYSLKCYQFPVKQWKEKLAVIRYYLRCIGQQENDEILKPYYSRQNELTTFQGCVMWGCRIVIPKKLRSAVLNELHTGHLRVVKMKTLARNYVWWPKMDLEIEIWPNNPQSAPLHHWYHVDYAGPFQGHMFLVIVDSHSKWPEGLY